MDQRPFGLHLPVIMTLLFLITLTLYLVKIAMQASSQSCESEIRVPVLRSSSTSACLAVGDRCSDN